MSTWSADSHVVEAVDVLREHFPRCWRHAAPRLISTSSQGDALSMDGMSLVLPISEILGTGPMSWSAVPRASWDAEERVAYQRRVAVAGELIFPTLGLFIDQHPDREYRNAYVEAYNSWLMDSWCGSSGLSMVALLGAHDTPTQRSAAVAGAADAGFAGVLLPSEPPRGSWGAPEYIDLFSALAEARLLACFHVFSRPVRPSVSRRAGAVFAAAHEAMDLFSEFVLGKVLVTTPGLRVVVGEGETWWLPIWVEKLEERGFDLTPARRALRVTTDQIPEDGSEFTIYSSDFPHSSGGLEEAVRVDGSPSFGDGRFLDLQGTL
jgi:hypothetical protein